MNAIKMASYLKSGFPLFWMQTYEPNRVRQYIYELVKGIERKDGGEYKIIDWTLTKNPNPMTALEALTAAEEFSVLFAHNFHWYSEKPAIVQYMQDMLPQWASTGKAFCAVSPVEKIPVELSKDYVLMNLSLPDDEEIQYTMQHVSPEGFTPSKPDRVIAACKGLARAELEATLALSYVESGGKDFSIPVINEHKAQTIKKSGFLEVLQPTVNFSDIIGYNNIKQFVLDTIYNPKAKGIMMIGPPGTGKTMLAKAIVAETGKFGLEVNMGSLFSKYIGETDQNVKAAIDLICSVGECFVLIDEFEKQFAGAGSDGTTDSGNTVRATSQWLDFLQDRPPNVYVAGTANSFTGIPAAYLRVGRWDSSPFFIDLPTEKVKQNILKHYCKKSSIYVNKKLPNLKMDMFSGAEVEAMVHIASMRGIPLEEAEKCVISTAKTCEADITALRNWSVKNTLPAEAVPGLKALNGGKRKLDV